MKKLLIIPLMVILVFFSLGNQVKPTLESTAWERDGDYLYKEYTIDQSDIVTVVSGVLMYSKSFEITSPYNTDLEYYDYNLRDYNKVKNHDGFLNNKVFLKVSYFDHTADELGWHINYSNDNQIFGSDKTFGHYYHGRLNDYSIKVTFRYFDPFVGDNERAPIFSGPQRIHNIVEDNNTVSQIMKKSNIRAYDVIDGDLTEHIQIEHDEYSGQSTVVGVYKVILKVNNSLGLVSYYELTISNELKITEDQEGVFDPNYEASELKDLPTTSQGVHGKTYFKVDGQKLVIKIEYAGRAFYLDYSFSKEQDMEIFETNEAFFINIDKPQIMINHSDRYYLSDIIDAPNDEKPAFLPHSIWDLETNNLDTVLDYVANIFLKQNNTGVLISYVYIDEYIIDEIISATVSWTSRERYSFPVSIVKGKYSEYETQVETFAGNDYLEYKNGSKSWSVAYGSFDWIRGLYDDNRLREIPRINEVNLLNIQKDYNITQSEIEGHFREVNNDFDGLKSNPRYKLWAIALESGKATPYTKTELYPENKVNKDDPKNFKLMHIKYMTNGKIYETFGDEIDHKTSVHPGLKPLPEKPGANERGFIEKATFIGITAIIILIANGAGFFKDKKKRSWMIMLKIGLTAGAIFLLWTWFINYKVIFKVASIVLRL